MRHFCSVHNVWSTTCWVAPHYNSAVLGRWIFFNSRPCCEPSAMAKQAAWLPLVLHFSLTHGSNCLLLSLLGYDMFELQGQTTDVVLVSSV